MALSEEDPWEMLLRYAPLKGSTQPGRKRRAGGLRGCCAQAARGAPTTLWKWRPKLVTTVSQWQSAMPRRTKIGVTPAGIDPRLFPANCRPVQSIIGIVAAKVPSANTAMEAVESGDFRRINQISTGKASHSRAS